MLHSHMIISVLHMLPYSHLIPLSNLRVKFFGKLSSHLRYWYIFYGKLRCFEENTESARIISVNAFIGVSLCICLNITVHSICET